MINRFDNIKTIINDSRMYYNLFEKRGKNFIEQYPTSIIFPVTNIVNDNVNKIAHVWSSGDKYFSISNKYYDSPKFWWLIAWFNNKPTEQHIEIGETIYIPIPLNVILSFYLGG